MKKLLSIIVCKLLRAVGGILGKGSSLPGKIALKICPDILTKIKLPEYVIAVTGSNGKTSTVEMIANILKKNGKSVAWNSEGSNQIEGVTTLLLSNCSLSGKMTCDVLLIESDERYARHTFKHFKPTHFVITNLYRDQLTRNGHPEWVYKSILPAIYEETALLLNADDPLVSCFAQNHDNVKWFGLDECSISSKEHSGVYDDGKYCPVCKAPMKYKYYHYNHIGSYYCDNCGHRKHETDFTVTSVDLEKKYLILDGENKVELVFNSIYNVYNILAAYSICSAIGLDKKEIAKSISNFIMKNGRVVNYKLGEHKGTLLTSKHENSVSYDMSLKYVRAHKNPCSVIIIVDAVSRKYFTSETSWLWDIDFNLLNSSNVEKIFLCGKYAHDLAVRFSLTDICTEKITVYENIDEASEFLKNNGNEDLFTVTCFSDREKFMSKVEKIDTN